MLSDLVQVVLQEMKSDIEEGQAQVMESDLIRVVIEKIRRDFKWNHHQEGDILGKE